MGGGGKKKPGLEGSGKERLWADKRKKGVQGRGTSLGKGVEQNWGRMEYLRNEKSWMWWEQRGPWRDEGRK